MSKYFHISLFDPRYNEGGVAQFARHLKSAVPELKFISHGSQAGHRPWTLTKARNLELLDSGVIDSDTTVIADGFFADGLAGKVDRLIVVCHSTYLGWMRDTMITPSFGSNASLAWLSSAAVAQEAVYRQADQLVSVSGSAQQELWDCYALESTMIRNGVDTDLYYPTPDDVDPGSVVSVAGKDFNKGSDMIDKVIFNASIPVAHLGHKGEKRDRWRPYEIAFLPSRHEGGPYAQLEAMATNKKIVTYNSGFFKSDVPSRYYWGTYDFYWRTFERLIIEARNSEGRNPREWVLENATLDKFKHEWRNFLGVNDG